MLFDRFNAPALKSKTKTFPAPKRGWIKNETLIQAMPDGAEALDNFFPTAQGARLRKGNSLHATIGDAVKQLMTWKSGGTEILLAASATAIYDITTPADPAVSPTASVTGLTNGDWSYTQFANSGGDYLMAVNGADACQTFDGTTWTTQTFTGISSALLSQVFTFKSRLFFIEKDTLSFWYFAVNAIAGTITEFPLKGVFHLGGSLLFGATWSLDSGSGLDDVAIFVTTEGEIAVYVGDDPSSASTWALKGVYRIGRPLSKNGTFKAGGDLAILTEDGIIPVSEALQKDRAALQSVAITYPIEDAWQAAIANRSSVYPFSVTLWHTQTMLMIGTPSIDGSNKVAFVANSRTGAWCRFTGWDVQCSVVSDDNLYFGSESAEIFQAEVTGADNEVEYSGIWVPKMAEGNISQKMAVHARFRGRASETYSLGLSAFSDYELGTIDTVAAATEESSSVWGTAIWGTAIWGAGEDKTYISDWQSVSSIGTAISPAVKISSNRLTAPSLECIALDLVFQEGQIL
jgi:hypothetical protein